MVNAQWQGWYDRWCVKRDSFTTTCRTRASSFECVRGQFFPLRVAKQVKELIFVRFWIVSTRVRKLATIAFFMSVWYYAESDWTDFHKIWYWSTFENMSRIVLGGLVGPQVVKKSPYIFRTQMCTDHLVCKCALFYSWQPACPLSWATSIHSTTSHSFFFNTLILLSSQLQLCLPSCLFPYGFPTKSLYAFYMPPTSHYSSYHHTNRWLVKITK